MWSVDGKENIRRARPGFQGSEELSDTYRESWCFIWGFGMQVDVAMNGVSLFAPFSFQRGLQHRGVPPCPAGRVPPGQLRNSSAAHSGWLLHPASKVGSAPVPVSFLFLCLHCPRYSFSSLPAACFPLGNSILAHFSGETTGLSLCLLFTYVSPHTKATCHEVKPLILRIKAVEHLGG